MLKQTEQSATSVRTPENFFVSKECVHSTDLNEPYYEVYSINCNDLTIYEITEEQFRALYALMGKFIAAADEKGGAK